MKYIRSKYAMSRARRYRKYNPRKKNIIFDSKGMYNDMIADKNTEYWCYRNKVDKTKIISYSGKAKCLCCKEPIIYLNEDFDEYPDDFDSYQDKYLNCDNVVCSDCAATKYTCDSCGAITTLDKFVDINGKHICGQCFEAKVRICPDCGKPFMCADFPNLYFRRKGTPLEDFSKKDKPYLTYITKEDLNELNFIPIFCCEECFEHLGKFVLQRPSSFLGRPNYISEEGYDFNDPETAKYFRWNLKKVDIKI